MERFVEHSILKIFFNDNYFNNKYLLVIGLILFLTILYIFLFFIIIKFKSIKQKIIILKNKTKNTLLSQNISIFNKIIIFIILLIALILIIPIIYNIKNEILIIGIFSILILLIILLVFWCLKFFSKSYCKLITDVKAVVKNNYFLSDDICEPADIDTQNDCLTTVLKKTIDSRKNINTYYSIALDGKWGSGKTTILNALQKKFEESEYYFIKINFWAYKKPEDAIIDIERSLAAFFKEVYLIPDNKSLDFFKIAAGLYNENLSKILEFLFSNSKLESSKIALNNLLNESLIFSGKQKIVFIFDDLDRILDKNDLLYYLKIICYISNFDNTVSITSVDISRIIRIINGNSDNLDNSLQNFIYKIFNNIIKMPVKSKQSDLVKYIRNIFSESSDSIQSFKKFIDTEIKNEDEQILSQINNFINSEDIYDIFSTYREFKLTYNDFLSTLLLIKNQPRNINITDMISIKHLFLMRALKNVNIKFYNEVINKVNFYLTQKENNSNKKYNNIEDCFTDTLYIKNNENKKEDNKNSEEKKILEIEFLNVDRIFKILDQSEKLKIFIEAVCKFYLYPTIEEYQFTNAEIINHLNDIKSYDQDKIKNFIITNDYWNDWGYYEKCNRLKDYCDKIRSFLNKDENNIKILENIFSDTGKLIIDIHNLPNTFQKDYFQELIKSWLKMIGIIKGLDYVDLTLSEKILNSINDLLNIEKLYEKINSPTFSNSDFWDKKNKALFDSFFDKNKDNLEKTAGLYYLFIQKVFEEFKQIDNRLEESQNYSQIIDLVCFISDYISRYIEVLKSLNDKQKNSIKFSLELTMQNFSLTTFKILLNDNFQNFIVNCIETIGFEKFLKENQDTVFHFLIIRFYLYYLVNHQKKDDFINDIKNSKHQILEYLNQHSESLSKLKYEYKNPNITVTGPLGKVNEKINEIKNLNS